MYAFLVCRHADWRNQRYVSRVQLKTLNHRNTHFTSFLFFDSLLRYSYSRLVSKHCLIWIFYNNYVFLFKQFRKTRFSTQHASPVLSIAALVVSSWLKGGMTVHESRSSAGTERDEKHFSTLFFAF